MKQFWAAITIALIASSAHAEKAEKDYEMVSCTGMAIAAKWYMYFRQSGDSLLETIEGNSLNKSDLDEVEERYLSILIEAWEQPRLESREHQEQAVVDFENSIMLRCLKGEFH
ncbi:hypothetical protein XMV225_000825 [Aliiroseovarius sp. xm-v-225]|uniref:hypothetical protein n=1 Tax=unclassified Aliiroseovarius TaxID=2623558 RepID=UPI001569FFFF|nr:MULTISPECIES: hypothetical protein [unclassified Aliiroseovarius]NRP43669.1 hypothetical protein [Aliiroseovarius sp. xm-m-378]NRP64540.1 hypothetical protein [Aliiroseovarius sp. xm-v-225]NRP92295.1 hypothetical protein [Aliiroseovarius sp. xm-a-134]